MSQIRAETYCLANVRVPSCVLEGVSIESDPHGLCTVDLTIADKSITAIKPAGSPRQDSIALFDRHNTMVLPGFIDRHTHLAARGIPVAFASDNTRDPFFAYGDQDMLEVLREATRIAHLDHPIDPWPASVTRVPADIMRLPGHGRIAIGLPADLVMFPARNYSELYSRPHSDRVVVRGGQIIDSKLPDYGELD